MKPATYRVGQREIGSPIPDGQCGSREARLLHDRDGFALGLTLFRACAPHTRFVAALQALRPGSRWNLRLFADLHPTARIYDMR